ncbi:aspartyl protease family protein 2 [Argentina anserina]|uniref:aspartyl protease family protein 2 n=1 Tax=Argentina anserina TaxID=57926 RepID=UPI00217669FE|nr:aspartyl protease family protein 2 [Potentilla anserina]
MVSLSQLPFFLIFFLFTTLCNSSQPYLQLPLLHRHPSPTPTQALSSDTRRLSLLHSRSASSPIVSGASTGSGQYFVHLLLGSPPQPLLLVADTGSDLVWLRCSACKNCSRRSPGSAFLARHSSTFSPFHCYDSACRLVPRPDPAPCNHTRLHSPCRYQYTYSDGSTTAGFFSKETTALNTTAGKPAKLPHLSFGCGFDISGPSLTGPSFNGAHGVMGLGRGPISFISQLGHQFGSTFSYCLMDYTLSPPPSSYLRIGASESDVVSKLSYTRLILNPLSPTFYYIGIKSVSVNGVKLAVRPSVWSLDKDGNGGTVIDSGTTLSFLPEAAYRLILTAFKRSLKKVASLVEPTPGFDLCVNVTSLAKGSLPRLRFGLEGGSVLAPPPRNYFIETMDRVECLAIQPVDSGSGFSVIGNLMQQGFLFEFDKDRSRLGFSRHGCGLQ